MCEFCKGVVTGNDFKELTHDDIDINGKPWLSMWSGLDTRVIDKKNRIVEPVLTICLDGDYLPEEGIARSRIKINYCPICGQKLVERSM